MRKPPKFILYIILIFLLAVAIFGCYSEKKATSQFNKAVLSYPHIPLDYCAAQFPDKPDSVIIKTDTLIEIATMDSIVYDSIYLNNPMLIDTLSGKLFRRIVKTQKIYIYRDSIIYIENRAEQERLQLALLEANKTIAAVVADKTKIEKERDEWKGKARKRGWEFWGLVFLVIGAIGMKLYTKTKKINI